MWAFEFYRDQASFDRHYSNPVLDAPHQRVLDLLADDQGVDASLRAEVHIVSSS